VPPGRPCRDGSPTILHLKQDYQKYEIMSTHNRRFSAFFITHTPYN